MSKITSKNQDYTLRHINKNKHKHYTNYFDKEDVKMFSERFAKDLELFNYKFGD